MIEGSPPTAPAVPTVALAHASQRHAIAATTVKLGLCLVLFGGCVVETVESRRPLSASGSGAATAHIVVPDCELGQAISADGCRDIVVKSETGSSVNLRLAFADTHCRSVYEHLRLANSRAREHRLSASPELREGLRLAHAECRLREEHIEACSAAGYFAAGGAGPGALRRYRSGLAACYKLTRIYRELIAQGLTRIP